MGTHTIDELPERLHRHIALDATSGCWIWMSSRNQGGYGQMWDGRTMSVAHRAVYLMTVGAIPDGLQLDHLCKQPACVNPAHLEPVTAAENARRRRKYAPEATTARELHTARQKAYRERRRARLRAEREAAALESGWWVSI